MTVATTLAQPFVNVKHYGVTGDGVTNDTTAIQVAITAAASSGAVVFFPPGTYKIASTITRTGGVFLRGSGIGKTTLSYTGSGTAIGVPVSGTRTFRGGIEGMTITTSTGATGIDLDSVSIASFEHLEITGFSGKSIRLRSAVNGGCVYNRFADIQVQSPVMPNSATGISIEATSSNANTFVGCRTNLCNVGVSVVDSNDNTFLGCQAESGGTGFYFSCTVAGLADWNRLIAPRAENNTSIGIHIADANVRHTVIFGEWLGSNGTDVTDLGTKTRRAMSQLYLSTTGIVTSDANILAPNFGLSSTSGALQAATSTGLYLRGNIADNAGNVGVWIGNNPTLSNASARVAGFCQDTPVGHTQPVAYIRQDGAYEFANGVLVLTGSGTPEGAVTAPVGSLFLRSDGGAGTSMYVKQSGAGSTGWVGK